MRSLLLNPARGERRQGPQMLSLSTAHTHMCTYTPMYTLIESHIHHLHPPPQITRTNVHTRACMIRESGYMHTHPTDYTRVYTQAHTHPQATCVCTHAPVDMHANRYIPPQIICTLTLQAIIHTPLHADANIHPCTHMYVHTPHIHTNSHTHSHTYTCTHTTNHTCTCVHIITHICTH